LSALARMGEIAKLAAHHGVKGGEPSIDTPD